MLKRKHNEKLLIGFLGSCGLAIAQGLKRANIPALVFERDIQVHSRVDARDWAIALHWAGPTLARLVGEEKWSRVQEIGVDPNMTVEDIKNAPPVKVLHGVNGETLGEMVTGGEPFFRLLRSRLVAFLGEGIDVRYSKTLDRFSCHKAEGSSQGFVTAHFTDGTEVKGRILIGADGAKSRVRSMLFEHDPKQAVLNRLPYAATFITASFTADQARHLRAAQGQPLGCAMLHPKGSISMLSIQDAAQAENPETWKFTFYAGQKQSVEEQDKELTTRERIRDAKEMVHTDNMADPLKSAFEWLAEDVTTAYYTKVANWDPSLPEHKWDNHDGLVTLAGDACHPMTYHRGQGKIKHKRHKQRIRVGKTDCVCRAQPRRCRCWPDRGIAV